MSNETTTAVTHTPITTVMAANRGEIARRVFRTAAAMGLRTVAIYVDADADAPFVAEADVAVRIPSYLDIDAVVDAATRAGADAIHPGYGFLSENAAFAAAVTAAGITWVGPTPDVIAAMGDKLEAKKRAVAAGVPTLPSSDDPTDDAAVGYPLLVKASAGGGGKGMRVVTQPADLAEATAAAQREALGGFGDDTVFLERYVPSSRHVEIQIMGDRHGTVVHYGERECSIQRRHQKIVEEAPSPGIDDVTRAAMAAAAVDMGKSLGYESAGTVEFLVDDASGEFFFLEVNTRLQVEHPVTELADGDLDLVRVQLEVAMGHPVEPKPRGPNAGHAIEVRLYAEDPDSDFLPAIGTLEAFRVADHDGIRWDTGVEQGSEVTVAFDPMLAKVISRADDRRTAALRLATELEDLHLGGVVTNRDFLVNVLRHPAFLDGDTTTDFIDRIGPDRSLVVDDAARIDAAVAGALWLREANRRADPAWGNLPSGWRNGRLPPSTVVLALGDQATTIAYRTQRDGTVVVGSVVSDRADTPLSGEQIEGIALSRTAHVHGWSTGSIDVELDGLRREVSVTPAGDRLHVQVASGTLPFDIVPRFVVPGSGGPTGGFVAPMPGVVLDVRVAAGDEVAKGQTLLILEAMKMEHHMNAAADGVVAEVLVGAGQQVEKDAVLLVMADDDTADETADEGATTDG